MAGKKTIEEKAVRHAADLSRISLSEEEVRLYSSQLAGILEYINKLNEVDISQTSPTSHPLDNLKNVFRKDIVRESIPVQDALRNAPKTKDNFFTVPKIID
ncbi:MAG: asparaginyl/glutamyl-tRNA amidotransferase subunit C [Omnitrophica bacterium RBG_13_46_9]|nr:MAG: asparaginyl/glutamyl-tRNA amidotransferase subunit C [Omnitrophica bacterium RBG_13_46_9]